MAEIFKYQKSNNIFPHTDEYARLKHLKIISLKKMKDKIENEISLS